MKTLSGVILIAGNFLIFLSSLVWGLRQGQASPDWFWLALCLYPAVSFVYYGDNWSPDGVDVATQYHLWIGAGSTLVLIFTVLLALQSLVPFWIPVAAVSYLILSVLEYLASALYFQESPSASTKV